MALAATLAQACVRKVESTEPTAAAGADQAPAPRGAAASPAAGSRRSDSFAAAIGGRLPALDFRIGELHDPTERTPPFETADRFCTRLVEGVVDLDLVDPGRQGILSGSLATPMANNRLVSYRLGRPVYGESGTVTIAVRLFGPRGSAEGEIHMVRLLDRWLVNDLQVDIGGVSSPRVRTEGDFFPQTYAGVFQGL